MDSSLSGIHHVTAIAGDPQRNLTFYTGTLGLRLVKRTVNYDDPTTYHLYYGDGLGTPGSLLTFFPWPAGQGGRVGAGQVAAVALSIPRASLGYWIDRLVGANIRFGGPERRFDERVLTLRDPDGLPLELVAQDAGEPPASWAEAPVPVEHAIRGMHSVTLWTDDREQTAAFLEETLGFRLVGREGQHSRYATAMGGPGALVDARDVRGFWRGEIGVGTAHHVAWRVPDDAAQARWRERLVHREVDVTPVRDRHYFHSIYFREPNGALFEIATDGPGFTVDEPPERLGQRLQLPPWLEPSRPEIEAALAPLGPSSFNLKEENVQRSADTAGSASPPHQGQPILTAGQPLEQATAAMILIHGRGATAADILGLAPGLDQGGFAYLALQASGNTWYPYRFLEPLEQNEPWLSSALAVVEELVARINAAEIPAERIMLLGFSQGACLALEFAARNARRWGGVVGLSGGLIGSGERDGVAPPEDKTFRYDGSASQPMTSLRLPSRRDR